MEVDGVALELAHEPALRVFLAQGGAPFVDPVILPVRASVENDDGRVVLIRNEFEFLGSGTEVNGQLAAIQLVMRHEQVIANTLFVELASAKQALKVGSETRARQRLFGYAVQHTSAGILAFAEQALRRGFGRNEDSDLAFSILPPFAITATRSLGNRIQPGERAIDHGELNVHSCFDQLSADDARGHAIFQA